MLTPEDIAEIEALAAAIPPVPPGGLRGHVENAGRFRVVLCTSMDRPIDDGEVMELLPAGTDYAGAQVVLRRYAHENRDVDVSLDYLDPFKGIWGRLASLVYHPEDVVCLTTGHIQRPEDAGSNPAEDTQALVERQRQRFEHDRQQRERKAKAAETRARNKTKKTASDSASITRH